MWLHLASEMQSAGSDRQRAAVAPGSIVRELSQAERIARWPATITISKEPPLALTREHRVRV